jgi:integrase
MSDSPDGVDRLVQVVLSRLVGEYGSNRSPDLSIARRALIYYDAAPNQPRPEMLEKSYGSTIAALGTTRAALRAEWVELRLRDHAGARFGRHVLEALFPQYLWHILARMVTDGPRQAAEKIESALYIYSHRSVTPSRGRPEGGRLSSETVTQVATMYRRITKTLVVLRGLEDPCRALGPWVMQPPIVTPSVPPVYTDRSAPPVALVRSVLHRLDGEVKRRLRCTHDDELAALDALSSYALAGLWRVAKSRAILSLLALVGMRVGALSALRLRDYDRRHRFPDGTAGPAIALRPGKTMHAEAVRWKGLGQKEARSLDLLIRLAERLHTEFDGDKVLAKRRPMVANPFIFPGSIQRLEENPCIVSMSTLLGGSRTQRPLLPRFTPDEIEADPSRGYLGYSAHRLRHFAAQQIEIAAQERLDAEGVWHVRGETVAEAVLDHRIEADTLGYKDINSERGRETWSRFGVLALADRMWSPVKVPDERAFTSAVRRRLALEEALRRAAADLGDAQSKALRRGEQASQQDVLALIAKMGKEKALANERRRAEDDCRRLREDRSTWLTLDGAVPSDAAIVDLDAREQEICGGGRRVPIRMVQVRDWITVTEVGTLFGTSVATARRWVNGEVTPNRAGHPRNPWERDAVPVDSSRGLKRRRIWVGGISRGALSEEQHQALFEILARWPIEANWAPEDREAPLLLAEPFDAMYRDEARGLRRAA